MSDEAAAFMVLASIGLQGIRLANPTLGETFVVSGLGLIGLLTGQLLVAQGCRVLGLDPDPSKCLLAEKLGIASLQLRTGVDPVAWCQNTLTILEWMVFDHCHHLSEPVRCSPGPSAWPYRFLGVIGLSSAAIFLPKGASSR